MKNLQEFLLESFRGSSFKEEVKYKNIDFEKWRKEAGKDFEIEDLGDNLM